jgi:broad-specificity NMP kinase
MRGRAKTMTSLKKILIMGLPGAGKTTLAKLLVPRLRMLSAANESQSVGVTD